MAVPYRHPRGTRAALDALASAGGLSVSQIYHLSDENSIAIATTAYDYKRYANTEAIQAVVDLKLNIATYDSGVSAITGSLLSKADKGNITTSGLTMFPGNLLGRSTTNTGNVEEITIGSGLSLSNGILSAAAISSISGNAATATALQTARTINGVSFNGTGNITVTANTPTTLTFNSTGTGAAVGSTFNGSIPRIISYNTIGAAPADHTHTWSQITSRPTTLSGYGITDALSASQINSNNGIAGLDGSGKIYYSAMPVRGMSIFCSGKPLNNEVIGGGIAPYPFVISTANSIGRANAAGTSATTFYIYRNGSYIGSITFNSYASSATFSISSSVISQGDHIQIMVNGTPNSNLSDLSILLRD